MQLYVVSLHPRSQINRLIRYQESLHAAISVVEKARVIERGQFEDGFPLKSYKATAKKCTKSVLHVQSCCRRCCCFFAH